jgi:nicotinamidase-related amidase
MPSKSALIVVDMLSTYDHEDAEPLVESVRDSLPAMQGLIDAARERGVFTAYVNDHFGDWTANRESLLESALGGAHPELVEPIAPAADLPFLHKARHSIFYGTQVEYMLRSEGVERIVLVGQVTEQCILYSALDAYVRHFEVALSPDAVAHIHQDLADAAVRMMERNMSAEIVAADESAF